MHKLTDWLENDEEGRQIQIQIIDDAIRADGGAIGTLLHMSLETTGRIHDSRLQLDYGRQVKHLIKSKGKEWTTYYHDLDKGPDGAIIHLPTDLVLPTRPTVEFKRGIFSFLGSQRTIWMKDENWEDSIGVGMSIMGHEQTLNPLTYKAAFTVDVYAGKLFITVNVKFVGIHNLYARIAGSDVWILIKTFSGPTYEYLRTLAVAKQVENLELMLKGEVKNAEIGIPSVKTVVYPG